MRRGFFKRLTKFNVNWNRYENGFGNVYEEFWVGNKIIHDLTNSEDQVLQIDLESFNNETISLKYNLFKVSNAKDNYRLIIGEPEDDSIISKQLLNHNNSIFVTIDKSQNDKQNCAKKLEAGICS